LPSTFVLWIMPESRNMRQAVAQTVRAVMVSGGCMGLAMAEHLVRRGLAVILVAMTPQVLPPVDPAMAAVVAAPLQTRDHARRCGRGGVYAPDLSWPRRPAGPPRHTRASPCRSRPGSPGRRLRTLRRLATGERASRRTPP
jgi:hypothetical protein